MPRSDASSRGVLAMERGQRPYDEKSAHPADRLCCTLMEPRKFILPFDNTQYSRRFLSTHLQGMISSVTAWAELLGSSSVGT
jgi:hypothetical protein